MTVLFHIVRTHLYGTLSLVYLTGSMLTVAPVSIWHNTYFHAALSISATLASYNGVVPSVANVVCFVALVVVIRHTPCVHVVVIRHTPCGHVMVIHIVYKSLMPGFRPQVAVRAFTHFRSKLCLPLLAVARFALSGTQFLRGDMLPSAISAFPPVSLTSHPMLRLILIV